MKNWRRLAIIGLVIALIGLVGCFGLLNIFPSNKVVRTGPYVPKEGETTELRVGAFDIDTGQGVIAEVTLIDLQTNESSTKLTSVNSRARFDVVVGREYKVIVRYNNSEASKIFIMEPILLVDAIIKNGIVSKIDLYVPPY